MGTQVIVPYRDEDEARVFKPMGDLGQIVRMVSTRFSPSIGSHHHRNGISAMKTRLLNVCGIRIPFTILSDGTLKPSMFADVCYSCH